MDSPKTKSVRTSTPRVLTRAAGPTSSSSQNAAQKAPRVNFTSISSRPASAAAKQRREATTSRAPSVSRARSSASPAASSSFANGSRQSPGAVAWRSSSRSRPTDVEHAPPPPPLFRPPTTPAEVDSFVERLDYEQQLFEAYQRDELRKRGLNVSALPPSKPASRCGSVDSRASRGGTRRVTRRTTSSEAPHRRQFGPTAPRNAKTPTPRAERTAPHPRLSDDDDGADDTATNNSDDDRAAPHVRPQQSKSPSPQRGVSSQQTVLRPSSVRLGGPTATQAAAKRSAALRPSSSPAANAALPGDTINASQRSSASPPPHAAPRTRPVISGQENSHDAHKPVSKRDSANSSGADASGLAAAAASTTNPYEVQLEGKRRTESATKAANTNPTALAAPGKLAKGPPSAPGGATNPRSAGRLNHSSTNSNPTTSRGAGQHHRTATTDSTRATPQSKRTEKPLTIRHAKVPLKAKRPARAPPAATANSSHALHWRTVSGAGNNGDDDEIGCISLNSIGSSESAGETRTEPSPHQGDMHVPRLRLPLSTESP